LGRYRSAAYGGVSHSAGPGLSPAVADEIAAEAAAGPSDAPLIQLTGREADAVACAIRELEHSAPRSTSRPVSELLDEVRKEDGLTDDQGAAALQGPFVWRRRDQGHAYAVPLCALDDAACDAAGGWTSKVAQDLSELDALSRVWEGGGRGGQFLQLAPEHTDAPSASTADADHHFLGPSFFGTIIFWDQDDAYLFDRVRGQAARPAPARVRARRRERPPLPLCLSLSLALSLTCLSRAWVWLQRTTRTQPLSRAGALAMAVVVCVCSKRSG